MTTPKDIIAILNDFQLDAKFVECHGCNCDPRCRMCTRIVENAWSVAEALLIACRALKSHEHLVRGEHLENCDMCQALREIRSLPAE